MTKTARILAMIAIALFGCRHPRGRATLVRRALPGFSIELPSGVERIAELDYAAGKLRLEQVGGGEGMMVAYWSFGQTVDGSAVLEIARAAARSEGFDPQLAKLIERKPGDALLVAIDAAHAKLQSFMQCGSRSISVATDKVDELVHRQIVDSLRCEPDPAQETAATSIPVAIDLPGFAAYQRTPVMVALTSATSTVILRRSASSLTIAYLEHESAALFKAMKLDARAQPRRGDVIPFVANVEGNREWGVVRPIDCKSSNVLVIAFSGETASAQDLEQRVAAAHCLANGEAPPAWPDARAAGNSP